MDGLVRAGLYAGRGLVFRLSKTAASLYYLNEFKNKS